jgi:DNA invertase Pin-like site-specific DNA recombinase
MSRTAAYIRVSSKGQDHAMQRDAIERKGVQVDAWYAEKASAKTTQRPELQRLLADVRAGLITDLWVFRLDRLTRSGVADTFAVVTELRKAGCSLHSVADGLTVKPGEDITSDVLLFALGLAASLERTARNDRIAAARAKLAAKGDDSWGRPARMTPAQCEKAKRLAEDGLTVREIAQRLGVPRSTIGRALKAA